MNILQIIQTFFSDILDSLSGIIRALSVFDLLDILLLSFIIYKLLKFVKETRAEQLLKGIFIVAVILIIVKQLNLKASSLLSETFLNVGITTIIVMFQPELRRFLDRMGRFQVSKINLTTHDLGYETKLVHVIDEIVKACANLSKTATGALIVIERQTKLNDYVDSGTILNAVPSAELFGNIFYTNTPLHDGAVIVRNGEILAAACFLPKPQNEELIAKGLGSRHRAAIGLSEVSDAIVIVVSEETGTVSIAENGVLTRGYDTRKLYDKLKHDLQVFEETNIKASKKRKKRGGAGTSDAAPASDSVSALKAVSVVVAAKTTGGDDNDADAILGSVDSKFKHS